MAFNRDHAQLRLEDPTAALQSPNAIHARVDLYTLHEPPVPGEPC